MSTEEKQLPDLDSPLYLSQDQIREFQEKGHILVHNVATAEEISTYRPIIADAADRYNEEKRKLEDRDTYGKAFLQIMNLWKQDEQVKKFVLAKRFAKIAADLMGVENVRLYHDQALFKEPGGGSTPWHIDHYYWPLDTKNTITMWMPLRAIDEKMGMLTFASGSHKKDLIFNHEISDESDMEVQDYIEKNDFPITRASTMNAGDATFHYGTTIHGAPGNDSDKMREVITIIYFADGAKIIEPKNQGQKNDLSRWLENGAPGSRAQSPLNPLLL